MWNVAHDQRDKQSLRAARFEHFLPAFAASELFGIVDIFDSKVEVD